MTAPKTITKTAFICASRIGTEFYYTVLLFDPTEGSNYSGYIVLGTEEVTFNVPDTDPDALYVAALEAKRKAILSVAEDQAAKVQQRIDNVPSGDPYFSGGF